MSAPPTLERLIAQLSRLPGIGRKTAARLAMHLVNQRHDLAPSLAQALLDMADKVTLCERCYNISEDSLCGICRDDSRKMDEICVVEGIPELQVIEESGGFRGTYHVLHGLLSPMRGIGPERLRLDKLRDRCHEDGVREVLVATSLTSEGETTALYVKRILKEAGIVVSRLASGVPLGGNIEYMDSLTLGRAISERKPF